MSPLLRAGQSKVYTSIFLSILAGFTYSYPTPNTGNYAINYTILLPVTASNTNYIAVPSLMGLIMPIVNSTYRTFNFQIFNKQTTSCLLQIATNPVELMTYLGIIILFI